MTEGLGDFDISSRNGGEMALRYLLFRHYDRISEKLCTDGSGPWIHHAAKWAQSLVSHQLDDDEEYQEELAKVAAAYDASRKPKDIHPSQWAYNRRLDEMEAITRHINARGVFKEKRLHMDDETL